MVDFNIAYPVNINETKYVLRQNINEQAKRKEKQQPIKHGS